MDFKVKIDESGLNRSIALALLYTKRTPAQVVNTSACEIAIETKYSMPFTAIQRIDTELNVAVSLTAKKRGKGFLKSKKSQREGHMAGDMAGTKVPLAVLIIQARVTNPQRGGFGPSVSKYNESTGFRYARGSSPFKGVSPSTGRALMKATITRMINARHSSIKFLLAGWIQAVKELLPYSVNKWRKGSSRGPPLEGQKNYYGADLGGATPAQAGSTFAVCTITNNIGYKGKNAARNNEALWLHGAQNLQQKVNNEGAKNMQYALDKSAKEELEKPFNNAAR